MNRSPSFAYRSRRGRRAGFTLVELLVVLMVLGAMAAIVGVTWRPEPAEDRDRGGARGAAAILSIRAQALTAGKAVTRTVRAKGRTLVITALPDGRVVGAGPLGFDALSGRRARDPGPGGAPEIREPGPVGGATVGAGNALGRNERR